MTRRGLISWRRAAPKPEAVQDAGPEVLEQDVGALDQLGEDLLVGVRREVEGDRLLVAVAREEVRRLAGPRGAVRG
jgi:hypothetical protein